MAHQNRTVRLRLGYGRHHKPMQLPISYGQLRSLDLDEIICQSCQFSESQQRALIQSCRRLVLEECGLDGGGKGLVGAIVQEPERKLAIEETIAALPCSPAHEIIRSFIPQQRLTEFQASFRLGDYQAHRLLFFCTRKRTSTPPLPSRCASAQGVLGYLFSVHHPLALRFLIDQLSFALLRGEPSEPSMQWLKIRGGFADKSYLHQFMVSAVRNFRSNQNMVAAISARFRQDHFPFLVEGDHDFRLWFRNHAIEVLTNPQAWRLLPEVGIIPRSVPV